MKDGRGKGELAIGVVVRLNNPARDIEVGESTLIGAVERCGTLLDNEPLV